LSNIIKAPGIINVRKRARRLNIAERLVIIISRKRANFFREEYMFDTNIKRFPPYKSSKGIE